MNAAFAPSPTQQPHGHHAPQTAAEKHHAALVKQTQKWVAQTFYGNILKQMHDSPFKSEMLSGGRGGEAFGSMLDQQLADRMSRSAGSKLVNGIVARIEHAQAMRQQQTPRIPNMSGARHAARNIGSQTAAAPLNVRA